MDRRCIVLLFVVICLTNVDFVTSTKLFSNLNLKELLRNLDADMCSNLTFVTREQWKAKPPKSSQVMATPVPYAVVHHTDSKPCQTQDECSALMRAFQNYHMQTKGWDDIAYNFLIGGDQSVYIGRGWSTIGAHAGSQYFNSHSEGIAVIGTYTDILPGPGVLNVLKQLMECGAQSNYMYKNYIVRGHRDVRELGPTDCPGDALYAEIKTWPHYTEDKK